MPKSRVTAQSGARYTRIGKRGHMSPRASGGRGSSLRRSLLVLGALTRQPWQLPRLAVAIGVTWRTLYRDLEVLRAAGVEVINEGAPGPGNEVTYHVSRASVQRVLGL
jgi:hypothetical protein